LFFFLKLSQRRSLSILEVTLYGRKNESRGSISSDVLAVKDGKKIKVKILTSNVSISNVYAVIKTVAYSNVLI
jgi:hypothetical protein